MTLMTTAPKRWTPVKKIASACLFPILKQAARAYVAGETLADALRVTRQLSRQGHTCTLGYFDSEEEDYPTKVANVYLQALAALDGTSDYLSIKLPALGFSKDLLTKVAHEAWSRSLRFHFDAMWPESVDQTKAMVEELLAQPVHGSIGFTLPGRWRRSIDDARWAADHGLAIRVVKGQWPDSHERDQNLRGGFLRVINALAGRASHVAIASHDVPIVRESVLRLREAGTPCEIELLYGLPMRHSLRAAAELHVPVRVYVPYGKAHLPYAVSKFLADRRLAWWLLKDLLAWPLRAAANVVERMRLHRSPLNADARTRVERVSNV